MRTLLPLALAVTLAGPVACGPAPAPATPPQQTEVKPAPAQVATSAPLDLSPVAEPAELVGLVRWNSPAATIADVAGCAGLPPPLAEAGARSVMAAIVHELVSGVDSQQLGAVVALDAPVHLAAALDAGAKRGKPIAAVSLGLTSLEQARGVLERGATLTETAPGMWKIDAKTRARSSCFVAASAGSAPARLICGDRDRDVLALGPYLARTLPVAAPEARDAHGELRLIPLSAKFGGLAKQQLRGLPILATSQLSIGEPKFDRALGDAANAVQEELTALVDDADKLTFDIDVDGTSCVGATQSIQLRGRTSWLAGTIGERAASAGPAPALFWRLPKDSDTAFFGRSVNPARLDPILKTLAAMLEGWLDKENVGKPADRKAIAGLLAMRTTKETSSVSAHGQLAAPAAPAPKGGKTTPSDAFQALMANQIGWTLVGLDDAPAMTISYLKDLVAAYNRPALQAAIKKELGAERAKKLPAIKAAPAPAELGKGAQAFEIALKELPLPDAGLDAAGKPGAKPKTMSLTLHLLVAGDDKTTWIAFGQDKKELVKRLVAVKGPASADARSASSAGAPDADTLASRPGLEQLKTKKLVSGGFLTLAPLTRAFENTLGVASSAGSGAMPRELQQLMSVLGGLPHKGEGLILMTSQVQGGDAPRAELSFNLTKPALEDIGAVVLAGIKLAGVLNP